MSLLELAPEKKRMLLRALVATLVVTCTPLAYADDSPAGVSGVLATIPNLGAMITNFAASIPNLMRLVTAAAYVLGMSMIIASVMGMKHFGELRMMSSREHGVWGPLIGLMIGSAMLYLPTTVETVLSTFWQSTNPYAYITENTAANAALVNACYSIIQLIGTIAFIRGLMILRQSGSERGQPHMLGKGLTHLIGGILCINIYGTLNTLEESVGMLF